MMNKTIYTQEIQEQIRQIYQYHQAPEACLILNESLNLNLTTSGLRSVVCRYKLHKRSPNKKKRLSIYTEDQKNFLCRTYAKNNAHKTCQKFNKKYGLNTNPTALRTWMNKNKIFADNDGKFKKGALPWNIGTKNIMQKNSGSFLPGNLPVSTKPIGYERTLTDGHVEIKISEYEWRKKSHIVWEQYNGSVPENMIITFLNGDRTDCNFKNLILVSKSVLTALIHQDYRNQPAELKPAIMHLTKLRMEIKKQEETI